jgi:hypothetical protein
MFSIVLQPNPSHSLTRSLSHKDMLPTIPFCNPPKNPHLHHCLSKEHYFSPSYVGFFGFLCLGQSFTEKTGKARTFLPLPLSISLFLFVFLVSFSLLCLSSLLSFIISYLSLSFFFITHLSVSLPLFLSL